MKIGDKVIAKALIDDLIESGNPKGIHQCGEVVAVDGEEIKVRTVPPLYWLHQLKIPGAVPSLICTSNELAKDWIVVPLAGDALYAEAARIGVLDKMDPR